MFRLYITVKKLHATFLRKEKSYHICLMSFFIAVLTPVNGLFSIADTHRFNTVSVVGTFHEKGTKPLAKVSFSTKIHQTGVLNQKPQDDNLHIILFFFSYHNFRGACSDRVIQCF